MLRVDQVSGGYGGTEVIKNITFDVKRGELFGILGPNGSGKTTLLKMISGVLPFQSGSIFIKNKPISSYSAKELAKLVAVLSQHSEAAFSYTVKETVSLGRYAHQKGWFQALSEKDEEIIQTVMEQTGIAEFQHKSIQELSGGERQRVNLAQALAQEPEILLLDEPTNHLDLSYQKELLDLLKEWTINRQLTVISIFHDLNLASLYCDRMLLLEKGEIQANAVPGEVLKEERIKEVYRTDIQKQPHPQIPVPQLVLLPRWKKERSETLSEIRPEMLRCTDEHIVLESSFPLKTMSSGVIGSGLGWHNTFVNRHVDKNYHVSDYKEEMARFLVKKGWTPSETVGMMTAARLKGGSFKFLEGEDFSVMVVVTAGVGNAVDASKSKLHSFEYVPGTINTWIFINGELTEEGFIQSIMTATEAKVKVMENLKVLDPVTGTTATGTSTDSILIAATQKGKRLEFAGTITPLGKLISEGVYECTAEAIENQRKWNEGR